MNRHQSNPFLAGWETSSDTQNIEISENSHFNSAINSDDGKIHRSTSQAGINENPFGAQRNSADSRLYHRNMSSFEAASLQLEQQQLRGNGADISEDQTDLIAKMTAEFQSAIETNDKEFCVDGNSDGMNPFDPFETIVDDDISLHSPAPSTNPGIKRESEEQEGKIEANKSLEHQNPQNIHDSIDDDDDELVSTPVRNIKSTLPRVDVDKSSNHMEPVSKISSSEELAVHNNQNSETSQNLTNSSNKIENTNSMEKASLFASLLASAESSSQQPPLPTSGASVLDDITTNDEGETNIEEATRIIKGSPSDKDGSERPIGFFDPFETVIDKDALTSLMQETRQLNQPTDDKGLSSLVDSSGSQASEPISIHASEITYGNVSDPQLHQDPEEGSESVAKSSVAKTLVENASNQIERKSSVVDSDVLESSLSSRVNECPEVELNSKSQPFSPEEVQEDSKNQGCSSSFTPTRKPVKPKKKKSLSDEDSSDSSEEENRIQIVIKARKADQAEAKGGPTFVPLLPPPPSKSSMKQSRERGQVQDIPSPVMSYKSRVEQKGTSGKKTDSFEDSGDDNSKTEERLNASKLDEAKSENEERLDDPEERFVIHMSHSIDDDDTYKKPETPLYDEDTSYILEDFPSKYEGSGWDMMLRYPPKKKLTSNRFWKKIFVKLAHVPMVPDGKSKQTQPDETAQTCIALQIYDKSEDKKPIQEIPIQATYTVSEISSQQFDQFGKIFTIKLQYIFYKERVGVRQGQIARFIHSGHIGSSTTSGGHGVDPISIGAIKRVGAPIEHSPQISQIIKLGCTNYDDIRQFKNCLEDHLFKMPIHRDRALSNYKTEEVQMAVRDETYIELNQVGTIIRQLARVRLFFLSFLNGTPKIEVGINAIERQGREVVGRMDILPVVTEEWIRLEAWELHSTVEKEQFEDPDSRIVALVPPDATFFELMRFRVRPPRNRELPLQISADLTVTRTKVSINCQVMVPGCVSRKHGQIPCENIAIRIQIPECWIYFFREEKHFRMGSKKSVNRRPGKVKGIERFLGGGGLQDLDDESSLIEVTSGQAKYEHHHHAIVWRAARWPKESQSAYVQNTMKIRLPLTAYDKMPENFYEYVHVEYTMPATTVSHTTLRSISVNPCDDEPPEKYVKYSSKYEYRVKLRQSINLGSKSTDQHSEASPIVIMKQADLQGHLQREEDSDEGSEAEDVSE